MSKKYLLATVIYAATTLSSLVFSAYTCSTTISDLPNGKLNVIEDRNIVIQIMAKIDKNQLGLEQHLADVAEDVIHMPHNQPAIYGKAAYHQHMLDGFAAGTSTMEHQLIATYSFDHLVLARGRVVGYWQATGDETKHPFETKNLFVLKRLPDKSLQIWQIIYNMSPTH